MDGVKLQINIIDLVSETHQRLRQRVGDRWVDSGNEAIAQSESHLMARVALRALSLAEAARQMGISRQAVQKTASKLRDKGYLEFRQRGENRRDKYMFLTSAGHRYIELSENLKLEMEEEIMTRVGSDDIQFLKKILLNL